MSQASPELSPVAVEAQPVHHAAGTEGQRVARLVDDAHEGVGAWDPGQPVLGAVTAVHEVGQVTLGKNRSVSGVKCCFRELKAPSFPRHPAELWGQGLTGALPS